MLANVFTRVSCRKHCELESGKLGDRFKLEEVRASRIWAHAVANLWVPQVIGVRGAPYSTLLARAESLCDNASRKPWSAYASLAQNVQHASQGKGKSKTEPSTAPSTSVKRPWGGENNGLTCAACSLVLPPIHIVLAGSSTKRAKGDGKGDLKVAKSSKGKGKPGKGSDRQNASHSTDDWERCHVGETPQWDGNDDTWEDYKATMEEWMAARHND